MRVSWKLKKFFLLSGRLHFSAAITVDSHVGELHQTDQKFALVSEKFAAAAIAESCKINFSQKLELLEHLIKIVSNMKLS